MNKPGSVVRIALSLSAALLMTFGAMCAADEAKDEEGFVQPVRWQDAQRVEGGRASVAWKTARSSPRCAEPFVLRRQRRVDAAGIQRLRLQVRSDDHAGAATRAFTSTRNIQAVGFPQTGFEAQVNNSARRSGAHGSIITRRRISSRRPRTTNGSPRKSSSRGKKIKTSSNGKADSDYTEPEGKTGTMEMIDKGNVRISRLHDPKSVTYYRNIRVKPLPPEEAK